MNNRALYSLLALLFTGSPAFAATRLAASAEYADVKAAVDLASSGDVVSIPAGYAVWSQTLRVTKGIRIQGAGAGSTLIRSGIQNQNSFMLSYEPENPASNEPFHVSGITLDGGWSSGCVSVTNSSQTSIIDRVTLSSNRFVECNSRALAFYRLAAYGVVYENEFQDNRIDFYAGGYESYSWQNTPLETGSSRYIYVEDNTFRYTGQRPAFLFETGRGGKAVFRRNTVIDYPSMDILDAHGNMSKYPADRGTIGVEIYENTISISCAYSNCVGNRFFYHRGGVALVFDNVLTSTVSRSSWIHLTEEDDWSFKLVTAAPAYDTVNSSYFFNNTFNGNLIGVTLKDISDSKYIRQGFEYFLSDPRTAGYTPYVYPHPLREVSAAPSAPSALRKVEQQ